MASDKKIFAIFAVGSPDSLRSEIKNQFADTHLEVASGQWVVVGPVSLTTEELAARVKITSDPSISNGIVVSVSGYFGRTQISTWEWLTAKMGDQSAIAG